MRCLSNDPVKHLINTHALKGEAESLDENVN
jgi:hypothetical protein